MEMSICSYSYILNNYTNLQWLTWHTGKIFLKTTKRKETRKEGLQDKGRVLQWLWKRCPSRISSWLLTADMPEPSKKRHISISKQEKPDRLWMWTANSSCCLLGDMFLTGQMPALSTSRWALRQLWHWGMDAPRLCSHTPAALHLPLLSSAQLSSRPGRKFGSSDADSSPLEFQALFLPKWVFYGWFTTPNHDEDFLFMLSHQMC